MNGLANMDKKKKNGNMIVAVILVLAVLAFLYFTNAVPALGRYYEEQNGTGESIEFGLFGKFTVTDDNVEYYGTYKYSKQTGEITLKFEDSLLGAFLNGTYDFEKGETTGGQKFIEIVGVETYYLGENILDTLKRELG